MQQFISVLIPYRTYFLLGFELMVLVAICLVLIPMCRKLGQQKKKAMEPENRLKLKAGYEESSHEVKRKNALRQMVAPEGVDPAPNTYLEISEGGKSVIIRSVTISKLPQNVKYAETLKEIMEFPNSECSIFVEPADDIERKLDRQVNILEAEEISSAGNTNRVRKLNSQKMETELWAEQVESGNKKFFYVGFLFTFYGESVEAVNRMTDDFRSICVNKKMDISNCFAVQSEAYLSGFPFNRPQKKLLGIKNPDGVKMHLLDQEAASFILHYTSDHFTHKTGIPLARNLYNGLPYIFDLFNPAHDAYTVVMCGKTRSGKSSTIKIIMERGVPLKIRFVIIDSQTRKGTSEGEYASVTQLNGGTHYQISSRKNNILNIFDLQESTEYIKETADSGYERRTLDLNGAITGMVYNLRTMMYRASNTEVTLDAVMDADIDDILTQIVKKMFDDRGIRHGNPDSLYTEGSVVEGGILQSGIVPKKLPTMTEFYKIILQERMRNESPEMEPVYRYLVSRLREYVRELYYTEDSCRFFTAQEYERLPVDPEKKGQKIFIDESDNKEDVLELHGIRPYFDGQSTIRINRDCPITDIDISQLPEDERRVAREIAVRFMQEQFINKNSEVMSNADKIVGVVDEGHETIKYVYGRKILENIARTAGKKNAGLIIATQTVVEMSRYPETSDIMRQAAVKMVFKQDGQDREEIAKILNITDSQAAIITNRLGVVSDAEDPEADTRHRGEVCMIDGEQVMFLKVDYLRSTEKLAVETDASSVMKVMGRMSDGKREQQKMA